MNELKALYDLFKSTKSKQTPLSKLISNVNELNALFRSSLYDGSIADFITTAYKAHSLGNSVDPQERINELQNVYFEMKIFNEFRNILVHCRDLTVNIIINVFDYLTNNLQFVNFSLLMIGLKYSKHSLLIITILNVNAKMRILNRIRSLSILY